VKALAAQFSTEDLMRAFEVLTKADYEIRGSAQPRYHLEMALLRWIHLRKLVPLTELIQGLEKGPAFAGASAGKPGSAGASAGKGPTAAPRASAPIPRPAPAPAPARPAPPTPPASRASAVGAVEARKEAAASAVNGDPIPHVKPVGVTDFKEAFFAQIREAKKTFFQMVVAQAHGVGVEAGRIVFTFAPHNRHLRAQFDQNKSELETLASELAGRHMAVVSVEGTAASAPARPGAPSAKAPDDDRKAELRQQALADSGVQAMLDVFATEINDVEEIDGGKS
jgi:DNA polymerase-3 subunit gamma/tau